MGDLQQTDIVGPRYLRGPQGVTRYAFQTIDAVGHTAFSSQFTDKQTISLWRHLVETWRSMGIPKVSQMDNEMAAIGGGRYPYSFSQTIRLHLLLGIHLVLIPRGSHGGMPRRRVLRGVAYEFGEKCFCPTDEISTYTRVSTMYTTLRWHLQIKKSLRIREQGNRLEDHLHKNGDKGW